MRKSAGVVSIGLIGVGIFFGVIFMLMVSRKLGIIYIAVVLCAVYSILMNYCRKCPHSMNGTCHHVLPGRIAKKLPYKKTGKYTFMELFIVIAVIIIAFAMPVVYIYGQLLYLVPYVILWLSGGLLLRVKVCPKCYNRWCIVCPNRVK